MRKKKADDVQHRPLSVPLPLPERGKRVSPVRARRRKLRVIGFAACVVLIAGITAAVSYASYLPQYSVESINILGAQAVPSQEISDYVHSIIYNGSHHFLSRGNIFIYPKDVIEKDIVADFPRIASVQVSRSALLATAITVTVNERQTFALWCDANQNCYDMDQNGFIFAGPVADASSSQYDFFGGIATSSNTQASPIGETFASGHVAGLAAFLELLGQTGFAPSGATVLSDEDFTVPLAQGFYIEASFGEDPAQLVQNLQLILGSDELRDQWSNLEYIDLRFGDRVYYKLKGEDQAEASSTPAQ